MAVEEAQAAVAADPLRKALMHSLAFWSLAAPVWVLIDAVLRHSLALDFHYAYLPAAHAVMHGVTPYDHSYTPAVIAAREPFLYPPLSAYLITPFTLLPPLAAELLATVLVAATVPATLLALGVRDWRCHAIALLWWPTIIGIQTANVTLPMVLGLALVWRYRRRPAVVGLLTAFVVALKLFFWPVLVWLVATRRYRSAALAAVGSALLVLLPWAGIGFAGLRNYPHLLSSVSRVEGPGSYSIAALFHRAGLGWTAATAVELAVGGVILLLALRAGRRGRDRDSFAVMAVGILVLTPLLQMTYFGVLLVVVALYRRRLGWAWLVPLLIWGASGMGPGGSSIQLVHVLVVAAATVALAMSEWTPRMPVRALPSEGARQRMRPADPGSIGLN